MKLGLGLGLGSGNRLPRYVTDYFNGFELPGSTFSGGPTVVADNDGTLVTSQADTLPIEGMRLATTEADGAVLGENVVPNEILTGNNTTITALDASTGQYRVTNTGASGTAVRPIFRHTSVVVGRLYTIKVNNVIHSGSSTYAVNNGGGANDYISEDGSKDSIGAKSFPLSSSFSCTFIATGTTIFVAFDGNTSTFDITTTVTFQETVPTWLPTTSLGAPIHPSTPLRTRKGTVSVYGEAYKGPLIEPARTNLFLNSTVPVTQNITTTAQAYTVTVRGTGSITLSGTATGTATQGSPLTVTASAGTLTCTVTGTLTRVNVEAGAFGTSFINTEATTVTRPAANLTRPTAGSGLDTGNNFAIYGRVIPKAGEQTAKLATTYNNLSNRLDVETTSTKVVATKMITEALNQVSTAYDHAANTPFEYLVYQHSVHGMGIAVRSWNGSAWGAWSAWATNSNTQNAPIASTYQIGARNNANHFAANYPFTEIIRLNPNLHPQTQLADLLAKGRI